MYCASCRTEARLWFTTTMAFICSAPHYAVAADSWQELFKDPVDQRLDTSRWLLDRRGFLPVPLVITEPAVGYGGGVALVFFHRKEEELAAPSATPADSTATDAAAPPGQLTPPSVSAVMAAMTENDTKLAGVGHLGIWRDNTLRYTGALGAMSVNLSFYGGEGFPALSNGVEYNLDGWGTFQQLIWRWGRSDFWLGPQLIYFDASVSVGDTSANPAFAALNGDVKNTGAGIVFSYDQRDNIFTPSLGVQSEWYVRQHWGEFAKDFDYTEIDGKNRWYFQPAASWVLGWRLDVSVTSGDVPFYALPSINQRGIAKGRYQGEVVATTEVEVRYAIDSRWFAVGFGGAGRAADSASEFGEAESRWAGGAGIRYLIARELGLQAGIDVAKGPEEWTVYLQVGSGWSF